MAAKNPFVGEFPTSRHRPLKFVDKFGRAYPNGNRRIFKGKRKHNGRPLPLESQSRPQRALPTYHSTRGLGKKFPWSGSYLEVVELLQAGKRVPFLLKATTRKRAYWTIELEYKKKIKTVYKISSADSTVAFGIYKALQESNKGHKLGLYPI